MRLGRITIYARDVEATVSFYEKYFGFTALRLEGDRIIELVSADGGANLMIHAAAKSQKMGQVLVKLGFDVEDVAGFCARCAEQGLHFGPLHKADGYVFANAKDPSGNPISVTSRASVTPDGANGNGQRSNANGHRQNTGGGRSLL